MDFVTPFYYVLLQFFVVLLLFEPGFPECLDAFVDFGQLSLHFGVLGEVGWVVILLNCCLDLLSSVLQLPNLSTLFFSFFLLLITLFLLG